MLMVQKNYISCSVITIQKPFKRCCHIDIWVKFSYPIIKNMLFHKYMFKHLPSKALRQSSIN